MAAALMWGLFTLAGVLFYLGLREPRCPIPATTTRGAFVCTLAAHHDGPCAARLAYPGRLRYLTRRLIDWPRRHRANRASARRRAQQFELETGDYPF